MQKITTFLWFNDKAEEAMNHYLSIFRNSKALNVMRNGDAGPGSKGSVMSATFELEGQQFIAFNGGPHYTLTPAVSIFVNCDSQEEVDDLWNKLSEGGKEVQCGWLVDKYGLSWQIIPSVLGELLGGNDPQKSKKAMQAMMKMKKIDIAALREAAES